MKKLFLCLTVIFMLIACVNTAEKEKNDFEIIDSNVANIENNTKDEMYAILHTIIYKTQNLSVEKLDEAINNIKKHVNTCNGQLENELKNLKSSAGKEIVNKKIEYYTSLGNLAEQILSDLKNYPGISDKELEDKASEIIENKHASKVEQIDKLEAEINQLIKELKERIRSNNQKEDTK